MKRFLSILTIVLSFLIVKGNTTFEEANRLYKEGRYKEALVLYEELVESGIQEDKVYYNLGNAAYKLNQIGLSIWSYEKATRLKPTDKDVKHNLQLANLLIKDKVEEAPKFFVVNWLSSLSLLVTSNTWAWISFGLIVSSIIALLFYLFSKNLFFRKSGFYKFLIFIFLSILTLFFAKITSKQPQEAIVFAYSATAKSEPSQVSGDLFIIHEGLKVRIVEEEGAWVQIELANELKGWIKVADLRKL